MIQKQPMKAKILENSIVDGFTKEESSGSLGDVSSFQKKET